MITPETFLKLIDKKEEDLFKIGTIGSISGNKAHIIFDGQSIESAKGYLPVNYIPSVSDRVLLLKIKGTYLILGDIRE